MGNFYTKSSCALGEHNALDSELVDAMESNTVSNFADDFTKGVLTPKKRTPCLSSEVEFTDNKPDRRLPEDRQDVTTPKRRPEFQNGNDNQINEALEFNSYYVKLREQVANLMEQRQRHKDDPNIRSWNEQVRFSQELLIAALIDDFGASRASPYVNACRQYWHDHEVMLQGGIYDCPIDCEEFFKVFDIEKQGLIMFEEFAVILETINPELAQNEELVNIIFMFLDQTDRDSFNEYDLECFMLKMWGGDVGKFQSEVIKYMADPQPITIEDLQSQLRKKVRHNRSMIQINLDDISIVHSRHPSTISLSRELNKLSSIDDINFDVLQASSPDTDVIQDATSELLEKMRQLREDMDSKRVSTAFGTLDLFDRKSDNNLSPLEALQTRRRASSNQRWNPGRRSTSVRNYFQDLDVPNYFSDCDTIRESVSVSRTMADLFDEEESSLLDDAEEG